MKNLNFLLVIMVTVLAFTGCKKDNDPPSQSELIVGKDWKITTYFYSENNGAPVDLFTTPFFGTCGKDDIYKFSSDGKYIIDEGPTTCNQGDPQIYQEGTWTIAENFLNRTYAVTAGFFTERYTIVELTPSQMVLDRTFTDKGDTYTFKITYQAK